MEVLWEYLAAKDVFGFAWLSALSSVAEMDFPFLQ